MLPLDIPDMTETDTQQDVDMRVVKTMKDHFTVAATVDQPKLALDPQMLRTGRLGCPNDRRKVAGAEIVMEQAIHNLDTS